MTTLGNVLNNREIAILIWLGVFFAWALSKRNVRKSLGEVVKFAIKGVIFVSLTLMVLYIGAIIYVLHTINFWNISNLSDTVVWVLGVAFVMLSNVGHSQEEGFFRKVVIDNVKFVIFIEFIINLYVFDFWAEMILVPIFTIIGALLGVASANPKFKPAENFLTVITGLIGLGLIAYALYNISVGIRAFASTQNLIAFFLPLVLTILYLPFIYILAVFVVYDSIFVRINTLIKEPQLASSCPRNQFS